MRDQGVYGFGWRGARPVRRLRLAWWLVWWAATHISLPGAVLLAAAGSQVPYVMMLGLNSAARFAVFAVLSALLVAWLFGLVWRPRLVLRRQVLGRGVTDGSVTVRYELVNQGRFTAWDVVLDSYFLHPDLRWQQGSPPAVAALAPGERVVVQAMVRTRRRGRYTLPAVRAASAYPLGLCLTGRAGEGDRQLLVQPTFPVLQQLDIRFGSRVQAGGAREVSQLGASMEFIGCREYRNGDSPRHLHVRSWARLGAPVVKEFRDEYLCRTALILDTRLQRALWRWSNRPTDQQFEAAVALTAAVAAHVVRGEAVVELFAAGPEIYRFPAGRSLGQLPDLLDLLAAIEIVKGGEPLDALTPVVMREVAEISGAVVVLLNWDARRAALLDELAAHGVVVRAFWVVPAGTTTVSPDPRVTLVDAEQMLAGQVVRL
jgi:uncharacterized protein (DUF58 family)